MNTTKTRLTAHEVRKRLRAECERSAGIPMTVEELADRAEVEYHGTVTVAGQQSIVRSYVEEITRAGLAFWTSEQKRNRTFVYRGNERALGRAVHVGDVVSVEMDTGRIEREMIGKLSPLPVAPDSGLLIAAIVRVCVDAVRGGGQREVTEVGVQSRALEYLHIELPDYTQRVLWQNEQWVERWQTAKSALTQYGFWHHAASGRHIVQLRMALVEIGTSDQAISMFAKRVQTDTRRARKIMEQINERHVPEPGLLAMAE